MKTKSEISAYQKKWREENREKLRESKKAYHLAHKEKNNALSKKWGQENKERCKELAKNWKAKNRDKVRATKSKWQKNNKEKVRQYVKNRENSDPNFKLARVLRSRMGRAIRSKARSGSAVRDLGCTIKELKKYLEGKFQEGMSWENWGRTGWHIDHIIPLSSFDLTDPVQFKKAVHYSNLQPLWAKDNILKRASMPEEILLAG